MMTIITTCLIDADEDNDRGGIEKGVPCFYDDDHGYVLFIQGEGSVEKGEGRSRRMKIYERVAKGKHDPLRLWLLSALPFSLSMSL